MSLLESVEKQVFRQFGSGLRSGFTNFMRKIGGLRCFFAAHVLEKTLKSEKVRTVSDFFDKMKQAQMSLLFVESNQ